VKMILPFLSKDSLFGTFYYIMYLISSNSYYIDLYVTWIALGRLSNK